MSPAAEEALAFGRPPCHDGGATGSIARRLVVLRSNLAAWRRLNRDVRLFLISFAITSASFFGVFGVALNIYLLRLGYGPEFVGLVNGVGLLGFSLFAPLAGVLNARWGTRRAMLVGLTITAVAFAMIPVGGLVSPAVQTVWLPVAYAAGALGLALYYVGNSPFISSATAPEERAVAFAAIGALSPISALAGSLLAGLLPEVLSGLLGARADGTLPLQITLGVGSLLLLPCLPVVTAIREERAHARAALPPAPQGLQHHARRLIAVITMATVLRLFGIGVIRSFFNVYMDDALGASVSAIGSLNAAGQAFSIAGALMLPWAVARWSQGGSALRATVAVAICLAALAIGPQWGIVVVARVALMAVGSMADVAMMAHQMEVVRERWRSPMAGATNMALGVSWAGAAFLGGYIIAGLGYRALFLIGAGVTAVGAIVLWAHLSAEGRQTGPREGDASSTAPSAGEGSSSANTSRACAS